jgi:hypothetical protein
MPVLEIYWIEIYKIFSIVAIKNLFQRLSFLYIALKNALPLSKVKKL